jgi:nitrile hydratase
VTKAAKPVTAAQVANMVRCGSPYDRPAPAPALFKVGDRVRTRNMHPATHTRLPRYARHRVGEIVRIVGCHVFPDSNAINAGEDPHWLYTVRFDGRELWGKDSDPTVRVCIEAWEPYLEKP